MKNGEIASVVGRVIRLEPRTLAYYNLRNFSILPFNALGWLRIATAREIAKTVAVGYFREMSTPARMVELRCAACQEVHWEIDCDYRAAELFGGVELSYPERTYFCPHCKTAGIGYVVLQKSPPEFFLQPHHMYPMTKADFDRWVKVLRKNFPTHPMLTKMNHTWYPYTGPAWRPRGS